MTQINSIFRHVLLAFVMCSCIFLITGPMNLGASSVSMGDQDMISEMILSPSKSNLEWLTQTTGNYNFSLVHHTPGAFVDAAVQGDYAYVTMQGGGLFIYDMSYPPSPALVGTFVSFNEAYLVAVSGNYAYLAPRFGIAGSNYRLRIIDVSDPTNPVQVGGLHTTGVIDAWDIVAGDGFVYIADVHNGVFVINVGSPANPFVTSTYIPPGRLPFSIALLDNFLYVGAWAAWNYSALEVVNVANPYSPSRVGFRVFTSHFEGSPGDILIIDDLVYVADMSLYILWANPFNPIIVGQVDMYGESLATDGYRMYMTGCRSMACGVIGFDISVPYAPSEIAFHEFPNALKSAAKDGFVLTGSYWDGLNIFRHTGTPPPVTITHAEITQSIQCYNNEYDVACTDNSVPLTAGKPTAIRAYLESIYDSGPNVRGVLYASNGGEWVTIPAENQPARAVASDKFDRTNERHALQFVLPQELWSGNLEFFVVAYNGNNTTFYPQSGTLSYDFNEVSPLRIAYVPLNLVGYEQPDESHMASAARYIKAAYPIRDLVYFPLSSPFPYVAPIQRTLSHVSDIDAWYTIVGWPAPNGRPDHLYGFLPGEAYTGEGRLGEARMPGRVGWGYAFPSNSRLTELIMAHEIAHNLGIRHIDDDNNWPYSQSPTPLAIHDVGFGFDYYSAFSPLISDTNTDFMAAAPTLFSWVSAYTYRNLFGQLADNVVVEQDGQIERSDNPELVLFVSGSVRDDGFASFDRVFQAMTEFPLPASSGADYCLSLKDMGNNELSSVCFDLDFADPKTGEPIDTDYFVQVLSFDADAASLVLSQGASDLLVQPASTNEPSVTILSPSAGDELEGLVNVTWQADDDDGDELKFVVEYSADEGQNWHLLGLGIEDYSLTVDTDLLPGSSSGTLRVTVSDGFHSSTDIVTGFTIPSKPPRANISSPEHGMSFMPGRTLIFEGSGYDTEDGLLDDANLVWSSNIVGHLGIGSRVLVRDLPIGFHTVTLTVTDSDGNVSTAEIEIFAGAENYLPIIFRN